MQTIVSGPFEIELQPAKTKKCDCCGRKHQSLLRFVTHDDEAHAIYYAMVPAHEGEPVAVLMSLGDFDDQPGGRNFSLAFDLWSNDESIVTTVRGGGETVWSPPTGSRLLEKDEALAFMQATSFVYSELLSGFDPVIAGFLRRLPEAKGGLIQAFKRLLRR